VWNESKRKVKSSKVKGKQKKSRNKKKAEQLGVFSCHYIRSLFFVCSFVFGKVEAKTRLGMARS
jgi:hypothetical protein